MTQKSYEIEIITLLIKKYEKSKQFVTGSESSRKVSIKLYSNGTTEYPPYDINNTSEKELVNEAVKCLSDYALVNFEWMKYQENHIMSRVWLSIKNVNQAYEFIGKVPKIENIDKILGLLNDTKLSIKVQWICNYLDYIFTEITLKRSTGNLISENYTEVNDLMIVLKFIAAHNENEILERVMSVKCFNDSKYFERHIKSKLVRIVKNFFFIDMEQDKEDMLKAIGVVRYPELVEFCGNLSLHINNKVLDYSPLIYGGTLNSYDIQNGFFEVSGDVDKILFIENKANYVDYVMNKKTNNELVIFHGGFYSQIKRIFFEKVKNSINNPIYFFHWGDIDYGGFAMFEILKSNIFLDLNPYRMGIKELHDYRKYCINIDSRYIEKLKQLKEKPSLIDCVDCLEYMIENRIKLEQEALLVK